MPGREDFTVLINRMVPIGLLQIAAVLEQAGHATAVHDCLGPGGSRSVAEHTRRVLATDPEIVGFSATTSSFLDAYDMAVLLKEQRPDLKIVVGGAHASALGSSLLPHFPAIEYLCVGEGEGLMSDLAEGKPAREIGNLVYRENGQVRCNPRRPRLARLDELPFPAYHKLAGFPHAYHLPLFGFVKRPGATMVTSRGCTFTCSYCDRTVFERRYCYHSPAYVQAHMRWLRDQFGIRHINFYDDLFTADRRRVMELCDGLARDALGMDFNCAVRAGQADGELLGALKRAGCLQVSIGIESGSPELLARHKSGATVEDMKQTVEAAHAAGLRAKGLFIFGLPGETPQTAQTTSDLIASLRLDELNISKFSPFHGAPLWTECNGGTEGTFRRDWRLLNCLHFTFLPRAFKSRQEMDLLYNLAIERFYRGRHYQRLFLKRLWVNRWSVWQLLRGLMGFVRAWFHFRPDRKGHPGPEEWPLLHPSQPRDL